MKVGIYYGSTTGNAQSVAEAVAAAFSGEEVCVKQAGDFSADAVKDYDLLILGSSTWGDGELQDDWITPAEDISSADFSNCKVAVFGVGDGNGWADTFVDAMKLLYDQAKTAGAQVIGAWPTEGYDYSCSISEVDGKFVGLAIDESNQPGETSGRVSQWVEQLKKEMASVEV